MKVLHVGFASGTQPVVAALEALFKNVDWVRYSVNSWIIATDKSPIWWTDQFQRLKPDAQFVILEIKPETRWGFTEKFIWEWLDKYSR